MTEADQICGTCDDGDLVPSQTIRAMLYVEETDETVSLYNLNLRPEHHQPLVEYIKAYVKEECKKAAESRGKQSDEIELLHISIMLNEKI